MPPIMCIFARHKMHGPIELASSVPPEINGFWINQSFHNYADYALSDQFRVGLAKLLELSCEQRCAIMCSEAVWWRCHRRIVRSEEHTSELQSLMRISYAVFCMKKNK